MSGAPWVYSDPRKAEGVKGKAAGDCVCRAITLATGLPYAHVALQLEFAAASERPRGNRKRSNPRTGVHVRTIHRYLTDTLGWRWVATMGIGTGCRVHVRPAELPPGPAILNLSKHLTYWDGEHIHDSHDPSRDGTRCVYGYWLPPAPEA